MPSANRLARVRRLQWTALALCVLAITVNYVDRATVAIGTVEIRQEFGLSATAIGAMTSVWSISFALAQLPTGFLVDRILPRPSFSGRLA
jgi:sugar phosphate permease